LHRAAGLASVLPGDDHASGLERIDVVGHEQDRTPGAENCDARIEGIIEVGRILAAADDDEVGRSGLPRNKAVRVIDFPAPLEILDPPGAGAEFRPDVGKHAGHLPLLGIALVDRAVVSKKRRQVGSAGDADQCRLEAGGQIDRKPQPRVRLWTCVEMHHERGV
jgi:hypothetical protein